MDFYQIFEKLCKEKGVTPTRVARENGITQQAVSLWKKRGSTPKATTLQKLSDYFDVPVATFFNFNTQEMISDTEDSMDFLLKVAPDAIMTRLDDGDDDNNVELCVDFSGGLEFANAHAEAHALLDELNTIGAIRAAGYMDELLRNPRYRRADAPPAPPEGTDHTPAEKPAEEAQEDE